MPKNKQNGGGDDIDGKSETAAEREEELISFRYTWPVRITERLGLGWGGNAINENWYCEICLMNCCEFAGESDPMSLPF